MRILIVSPVPTHPVTAGNRARILALVQVLQSLGHEVHFALATLGEPDLDAMRALFGSNLHVLGCRLPHVVGGILPRLRRRLLRYAGSERAYLWALDDYYDTQVSPQLGALCARISFDVVCVEYVFMSKALEAVPPGALKILDTHDRFTLRHRNFLAVGQAPQWFSTTETEETAGLRRADYVLAIQEREAEIFSRQLGAAPPQVVTVGHLLNTQQRVTPAATPSAVFLASENPINVAGAQYFVDRVLPLVLRERADFHFLLAGDVGDKVATDHPAVRRLGRVPVATDAFRQAAIAVNPVHMGTGLNIKMLEALACGVACISSQTGSRGLERHREQAFMTVPDDDPAAMARAVLQLLGDRRRAAQLADAAFSLAQEWNAAQLAGLAQVLAAPKLRHAAPAADRVASAAALPTAC